MTRVLVGPHTDTRSRNEREEPKEQTFPSRLGTPETPGDVKSPEPSFSPSVSAPERGARPRGPAPVTSGPARSEG